jgi:DNA repair protein RecO (recombination protein O)
MEWRDVGLVISTRRHGERDAIIEAMTETHGRHLGLVRGGRSPRIAPALQPGNRVSLVWRARLEDHLGAFTVETLESRAGQIMATPMMLHAIQHLALLIRLLPERDPHPAIYQVADGIAALAAEPLMLTAMLVRFEALILSELGFGLDLEACAATGGRDDLAYVSPRTGRAVSREAGAPWAAKLLPLPPFMLGQDLAPITPTAIAEGFRLTGFFLDRHVFEPRAIVERQSRSAIVSLLATLGGAAK